MLVLYFFYSLAVVFTSRALLSGDRNWNQMLKLALMGMSIYLVFAIMGSPMTRAGYHFGQGLQMSRMPMQMSEGFSSCSKCHKSKDICMQCGHINCGCLSCKCGTERRCAVCVEPTCVCGNGNGNGDIPDGYDGVPATYAPAEVIVSDPDLFIQ